MGSACCRAGDERAWNEFVERFWRHVYAFATQAFRLDESGLAAPEAVAAPCLGELRTA